MLMISLHVVEVNGHSYAVAIDRQRNEAMVSSKSTPGASHFLNRYGECDCPYYATHRGARFCSHIKALTRAYDEAAEARRQKVGA